MSADRRPPTLLPVPVSRLVVYVPLAGLGVIEWARMIEGLSRGRALTWVIAGLVAAGVVLAADRARPRWRGALTLAAAVGGLGLAFAVSGLDLGLLRPSRWAELGEGLARGTEALGGVRLPYAGDDMWPALALQLGGATLCVLAGMLAVWPRGSTRGHAVPALTALLVLVASPVVSLGASRSLAFGAAVALLTAAFLWLERLPVRPGPSIAVLLLVTFVAALPLGAAADRDEPWFDYRAFAESIGPTDPVRFDWNHAYGPIDFPRNGVELFRVTSPEPRYWKAETLSEFSGARWEASSRADPDGDRPEDDLPADWQERPGWTERFKVSIRRLRTETVVAAGTILDVEGSSRPVQADVVPGRWLARRTLGRGDSYSVVVHAPRPSPAQLSAATAGANGAQRDNLRVRALFREDAIDGGPVGPPSQEFPAGVPASEAEVTFPPYGVGEPAVAEYRQFDVAEDGDDAMRRSTLVRSWRLARRLKRGTRTPYELVRRVNDYLRSGAFTYSELPAADGSIVGLERFLFEVKRGYCQQFSGAMALLLRMGGVPARVATGFSPGGYRKRAGEWIVRDTDAHSWVEAWFDRVGWVTFDPTPPATPARSQIAALAPAELPEELGLTPTPERDVDPLARRPEGLLRDAERGGGTAVQTARDGGAIGRSWPALLVLPAAALVWWLRRRGVPSTRSKSDRDDVAELERALRRAGRSVPANLTLAQLERRLGSATYVHALRTSRFGRARPPSPADRAAFRRELGAGLGWAGVLRAWWALPPRIRFGRRPS